MRGRGGIESKDRVFVFTRRGERSLEAQVQSEQGIHNVDIGPHSKVEVHRRPTQRLLPLNIAELTSTPEAAGWELVPIASPEYDAALSAIGRLLAAQEGLLPGKRPALQRKINQARKRLRRQVTS